jgi:hypothetical protein
MKEKLSTEQKLAVMAEVPTALRTLAAERDYYRDKLASIEGRQRVEKLASVMIDKGLTDGTVESVADELEKEAKDGRDLKVVEEAVDMVGPDMGKTAHISDEHSSSSSDFERYLTS